ncbi:hypothetical protein OH76DRAFT_1404490 [Lentinus brumalis]|uniref:Uncharacterized protein n=1 Tax=Lentinus brumalis TaxID=2498619 RepID=A0A371D7U1_9APHY|nr:hypothetical protein OH76DRAFT_1404490 [Polyporus brumalis]
MTKRPPTPPIEDGARYLTVVYPYPSRPNTELETHQKLFARWVAACIDDRYLLAFYHKPTSPGCIIIEIDESLPDFYQILGAHRWCEFLKQPKDDDAKHVSKVFYCTYKSDRLVQKNGWKRVDIKDGWFKSKCPSQFASPYPTTRWCDIPKVGDVIQNDLCEALRESDFPPPPQSAPAPVAPVVGTSEWLSQQELRVPGAPIRTWARGTPLESLHRASVPPAGNLSTRSGNSTPDSDTPSSCSSAFSSRREPETFLPTDGVYNHQLTFAGRDVEAALDAMFTGGDEDPDDHFYDTHNPGDFWDEFTTAPDVSAEEGLWAGFADDEDEDDPQDNDLDLVKAAENKPELCPTHNTLCSGGICQVHRSRQREEEKKRREEERRHQREDSDKKNAASEGVSTPSPRSGVFKPVRAPPPRLRDGPPASAPPQLPAHLRRGAAPASAPSPIPVSPTTPPDNANVSPTPQNDSAQSVLSGCSESDAAPEDAPVSPPRSGASTPARASPSPPPHTGALASPPRQLPAHLERGAPRASAPTFSSSSSVSSLECVPPRPLHGSARSASSGSSNVNETDAWR